MANEKVQLVVIGAGPGGYTAAFMGADLGMDVALIDPQDNPGGVCLYRGCIPSKALLHAAKTISDAREAERWGIVFDPPRIDLDALRKWKNEVVAKLTGGLGQLAGQRNVRHIKGRARFTGGSTLKVITEDGQAREIAFQHAIIATGSHAMMPPGMAIDSDRLMTSTQALDLPDLPERLLVIGGGYIGLEMGTAYAALGSKVTVVEMTDGLLPGVDRDLVRILSKRLADTFAELHLATRVAQLRPDGERIFVSLEDKDGHARELPFDRVLAAVGRRPNSRDLGLEHTRVEVDPKGFIKVDGQQRTGEPAIFAIGDVAGEPMLAHKAFYEGRVAAEAASGRNVVRDMRAIPAVVFTDPEIAWAGLTEAEAKARQVKHEVVRFPWAASGRALTLGRPDGLTKLIIDPDSERILGVGLAGAGAGELIAEGVLAMELGAGAGDLGLSIHPHPTLTETFKEAADMFHGIATHIHRKKRK
jgi:dihydrolipoamide dehydrogenase